MVRLTVMYPTAGGSTFDWDYYLDAHLALVNSLLPSRGLLSVDIERGIAGFPPGSPPSYHAVAHLAFASMDELASALEATAPQLIADQRKYFSGESVVQISEVLERGMNAPSSS